MPLSEHEQRLFDQIERSLSEDPKFASAVKSTDPRYHARRRVFLAIVLVVVGLAVLVFGVAEKNIPLGVAGFVVMMAAVTFGLQSLRRGRHPGTRTVSGAGTRRAGKAGRKRGGSWVDRLEQRWRDRPEGGRY